MKYRVLAIGLVLALAVVVAAPALAGPVTGPEGEQVEAQDSTIGVDILLSTRMGLDYIPAVAYNPAGQFLVAWRCEEDAPGGAWVICGQFYDEQGEPQGETMLIGDLVSKFTTSGVAYSPACDCYLAVWTDTFAVAEVHGALFSSDGNIIVADLLIYEPAPDYHAFSPSVASDGTDFHVVWQTSTLGDDAAASIYGRQVNANGDMPYPAGLIAGGDETTRENPTIAYNPFAVPGEYLVAMRRGEFDESAQITARRVRGGVALGAEYTVAAQSCADLPAMAAAPWDGGGAWVVTWGDWRNGDADIFGRVVLAGSDNAFDDVDFPISTIGGSIQTSPVIARSPTTGQLLVTWVDARNSITYDHDLYAQRLDAGAALLGPELVVSDAPGGQVFPAIAAGETPNVYLVAWADQRTGDTDIYGQRIAWNGTFLQSEFAISAQPDYQVGARVAYDPERDQYLAVWVSYAGDQRDIYGQRLSADGLPLEAPWAIEADGHTNAYPDVAYSSDAECFIAVWDDFEQNVMEGRRIPPAGDATSLFSLPGIAGGGSPSLAYDAGSASFLMAWSAFSDLWIHALNQDGTPLAGDNVLLAGSSDSEAYPAIAADSANHRYLVVWELNADGLVELYGHLVGPYGNLIGDPFLVAGGDGLDHRAAAVAFKPPVRGGEAAGEYLVVYAREAGGGSFSYDLYGRRLDEQGTAIGSEFLICGDAEEVDQYGPAVAYSPEAGRYLVVWGEDRDDGNEIDLYSRWLVADGSPASAVLPLSRHPGDQVMPSLAYDYETQRALASWWDYRTGPGDVHAQLVAVDATPPTAAFTRDPIVGKEGDTFTLNAWPSSDDTTPKVALSVRWDWTSNGSWDTPWSLDKYVDLTIPTAGTYTITLQVRDLMSQTGNIALPIYVQPANPNTPPVAALTISPLIGQAGANTTFDATGCTDAETPPANLAVRWDWENDGTWDTNWSVTKIATHATNTAGFYIARVEVRDGGNLTAAALHGYLVLPAAAVVVEISPPLVSLVPGTEFQFRAEARDAYGNVMGNPPVTWSVTDAGAGTIGASGLFTAGLEAGLHVGVVVATWDALSDQAGVIIAYPYRVYLPVVMRNYP
jgi:hypothetical protein